METKHPLAIRYSDQSVLENHHVAASFALMQLEEYNFLSEFSKEDYKRFREVMIHVILATDMSKHFADLGKLKARVAADDFSPSSNDKMLCLDMAIHLADISNTTKKWHLCKIWIDLLFEEFFT